MPTYGAPTFVITLSLFPAALLGDGGGEYDKLVSKGMGLMEGGSARQARQLFRQAVSMDPGNVNGYHKWGLSECAWGRADLCEKVFTRGLKRCPARMRSRYRQQLCFELGRAFDRNGSLDKALTYFGQALQADTASELAVAAAFQKGKLLEDEAISRGGGWINNTYAQEALATYLMTVTLPSFNTSADRAVCYGSLGQMYKGLDELELAEQYLQAAVALEASPTTKLAVNMKAWLIEVLQWQGKHAAADGLIEQGIASGVWERPDQITASQAVPGVTSAPWPDASRHKGVVDAFRLLEEGHPAIWREARDLMSRPGPAGLSYGTMEALVAPDGSSHGRWHAKRLDCGGAPGEAPRTCAVVRSVNASGVRLTSAQFLRLEPGSAIRPHCGPTNTRWVAHLGLDVPGNVTITVGRETRPWVQGKVIVFDDSFRHSVVHGGDRDRIVFAIQMENPEISRRAAERTADTRRTGRSDL
mmetsp:Transcript_119814/g.339594  ORF Transcript_119814/g.339594 Transcript_119814/m.339594 type:complete len:473 (+) Transcript_119814:154-1572(+)